VFSASVPENRDRAGLVRGPLVRFVGIIPKVIFRIPFLGLPFFSKGGVSAVQGF